MEGAILAGKLAAEVRGRRGTTFLRRASKLGILGARRGSAHSQVVAARALGKESQTGKDVEPHIVQAAAAAAPRKPPGCGQGDSPITFGGGEVVAARGR